MFRKSNFVAIALSVAAIASAAVPAAAYPTLVRGPATFNRPGGQSIYHGPMIAGRDKLPGERTTVGTAEMPIHFPTKKKD